MTLITCSKCETNNREDAVYCVKCGAKLEVSREESWDKRMEKWGEDFGKRAEEWGENFGRRAEEWGENLGRRAEKEVLNVGVIFSIIIGAVLILVGIAWFSGIEVTRYFWSIIIIVFGLLVLTGVIYGLLRSRFLC